MADLGYSQVKINDIEVAGDAPVTAALFTKIGGAINYLLDKTFTLVEFTTPGSTSWVAPDASLFNGVVFVYGCGGGSGGRSSGTGAAAAGGGGAGGKGCEATLVVHQVTPGSSVTVIVGAGGPAGTVGGNSQFDDIIFSGADLIGVSNGGNASGSIPGAAGVGGDDYGFGSRHALLVGGGDGGRGAVAGDPGNPSRRFSGGAAGSGGASGGGGGAGSFGPGGVGGNSGAIGGAAPSTSYGAGGGGGGGSTGSAKVGGAGAGGYVAIIYFSA